MKKYKCDRCDYETDDKEKYKKHYCHIETSEESNDRYLHMKEVSSDYTPKGDGGRYS